MHKLALSNQTGDAQFFYDKSNHGGHSLHKKTILDECNEIFAEDLVHTETLDSFGNEFIVDFIKMDVQGHEGSVLAGSMNVIKKQRPVFLIECFFNDILEENSMIIAPFKDNDYVVVDPCTRKTYNLDIKTFSQLKSENLDKTYCDLAFMPVEKVHILKT